MSRSRRKTPIFGNCRADSDKWFKQIEHRRERSTIRQKLHQSEELPPPKAFGNPCKSDKDGKRFIRDCEERWMRK